MKTKRNFPTNPIDNNLQTSMEVVTVPTDRSTDSIWMLWVRGRSFFSGGELRQTGKQKAVDSKYSNATRKAIGRPIYHIDLFMSYDSFASNFIVLRIPDSSNEVDLVEAESKKGPSEDKGRESSFWPIERYCRIGISIAAFHLDLFKDPSLQSLSYHNFLYQENLF